MRESVEAILEAGPCRIGPLLRVIGGRICREKLWSTSKSAINVNGIHRVYTSQEESSIQYLAHGHSLSGA